MKIVQVNCVYSTGSTGKIVYDIHCGLLTLGIDSVVCYGRGTRFNDPRVYKLISESYGKYQALESRISGLAYGGCRLSTVHLISIIRSEKPDIVHLHCINGHFVNIYKIIQWLKDSKIKTVLTLHAEFMYTANCGHSLECEKWKTGCGRCPRLRDATGAWFFDRTHDSWMRMKSAFDGFDNNLTVVSVSPWLMERAQQSPILGGKRHVTILNGVDADIYKPYAPNGLKASLGIDPNEKVVFHATPGFSLDPNHIKGGYYVVELAKRLHGQRVRFVIAGEYDQSQQYPDNMLMLGHIHDQVKLAQLYAMADVTLLTSKKETFSMVVAESLCCGTPVVGFKAGAPEQVAIDRYSDFTEFGNIDLLKIKLLMRLASEKDGNSIADEAARKYTKKNMIQKYCGLYYDVMQV